MASFQYKLGGCTHIPTVDAVLVAKADEKDAQAEQKQAGSPPQTPATANASIKYIYVSQNNSAVYLLRNDGTIDRSTGSGKIQQRIECETLKVWYVDIACGVTVSYFIRSDGKVDRSEGSGKVHTTIDCPDEGVSFIAGSGADSNTYLIGDNGVVYGFRSSTDIRPMPCTAGNGVSWSSVSGGINTSYFLRTDGRIEYTTGNRAFDGLIECKNDDTGLGYVQVSSQMRWTRGGKGEDYSNMANYFVRGDGSIDRTTGQGNIQYNIQPPAGLKYVAASAGHEASYYIRSDGAVDRTTGSNGKVNSSQNPPPGCQYIQAVAGSTVYLLRSDGIVDRCSGGKCTQSIQANNDEIKSGSSCVCM